jgi:site-specific recombinase XerD
MTKKKQPQWDIYTLADSFERSLLAENLSPHTIQSYLQSLKLFARFMEENYQSHFAEQVQSSHIKEFLADCLASHSPATGQTRYRGLKAFFKWCAAEEILSSSPMGTMTIPKGEEKLRRVLSDDELRALFKTCTTKSFVDLRDLAIMRLFLDSGMRLNELRMLKFEDLEMKNFCVIVRGKGAKWRYCVFGAKTAQAIDRYIRVRNQHVHAASEFLWIGQRGPITDDLIQKMFAERGEAAGIDHMHPHLLRHSFIDRMKRSGMSEENIMQLTGHTSTEVFFHYAKNLRAERAMQDYKSRAPGDKI